MNFIEAMNVVATGGKVARQCWPRDTYVSRTPCGIGPTHFRNGGNEEYTPLFADTAATDWYAVYDQAAPRYDFLTLIRLLERLPGRYCGVRDAWTVRGFGLQLSSLGDITRVSRNSGIGPRLAMRTVDFLATDWYITDLVRGDSPSEEELRAARPVGQIISVPALADYDARLSWDNVREFLDAVANRRGTDGPVWEALCDYVHGDEEDEG